MTKAERARVRRADGGTKACAECGTGKPLHLDTCPRGLTDLEREVLRRVVCGADPWNYSLGDTRVVSSALGRLARKGMIRRGEWCATDAGLEAFRTSPNPPTRR